MGTSFSEQEVTITFLRDEKVISVYSSNPVYTRKLEKLIEEKPGQIKKIREDVVDGEVCGTFFEMPKTWLKLRPPRVMSEEQKEAMRERAKILFGHNKIDE